jgi:hypothetical protein
MSVDIDKIVDAAYPIPITGYGRDITLAKADNARARKLARVIAKAVKVDTLRWAADELMPPPELPRDDGTFTATVFAKAFRAKADAIEREEKGK